MGSPVLRAGWVAWLADEGKGVNVKAGDLAIIRGMIDYPEDNGKIVEVLRRASNGEEYITTCGKRCNLDAQDVSQAWRVRAREPLRMIVRSGQEWHFFEVPIAGYRLIPISGVPVTDDIDTEIPA